MNNMDGEKFTLKFYLTPELYHQLEFQAAVDSDSMSAIVERALAYFTNLLGNGDKAEASDSEKHRIYTCLDYEKLLEINPNDYKAWYRCGVILKNLERYEEAIISFEKALEIKPDDHKVWYSRGNALYGLDFYEEAIVSYDKALEIEPRDYAAWYNRGNALSDLGLYIEAIRSYDKALKIQPGYYHAWSARANSLYHLGNYKEAISSYNQVLAIKPDDYHAGYSRTIALQKLDRIAPPKSNLKNKTKVTLYLLPELHRQLKIRAAIDSEPMSAIAERAIIFYLDNPDPEIVGEIEAAYGQTHRVYSCPECTDSPLMQGELVSLKKQPGVLPEEELTLVEVSIKKTASDPTFDIIVGC